MRLRSATVQTFALGLHELATNAVKHGAPSGPQGSLIVRWQMISGSSGERRLQVKWEESGGLAPLPAMEQSRPRGYGRELIERALPDQLGAEIDYLSCPEGAHCAITLPISPHHAELESA